MHADRHRASGVIIAGSTFLQLVGFSRNAPIYVNVATQHIPTKGARHSSWRSPDRQNWKNWIPERFQFSKLDSSITVLPMRRPRISKLDPHRSLLLRLWKERVPVADIKRILEKEGCSASPTAITTWFTWRMQAGELPPDKPGIGEASTLAKPGKALLTEPRSLGLLDPVGDEDQQSRVHRVLRILFDPESARDPETVKKTVGPLGLGVPLDNQGEPDFSAYARQLGKRRVRSFGDMDFALLAMWTRKYHEIKNSPQGFGTNYGPQRRQIISLAKKVRADMYAAVGWRWP